MTGLVGDTGAVVALATGSTLHARDLLQAAVAEGITLAVPAAAYAAAWASSAPLGRLLLDSRSSCGSRHRPSSRSRTAAGWDRNGWWPASSSTTEPALRANSRCRSAGVPLSWAQTR